MNTTILQKRQGYLSIAFGFIVLFAVYHSHEFFQSLAISAVAMFSFLAVSHVVAWVQGLEGIKSWGLALKDKWWQKLLIGLGLGVLFVGLSTAISIYLGYERIMETPGITVFFQKIWWVLFMTFWPSLAEDILTRGYLYRHLGQRMPSYTWILFSAVVYVLNHIWRLTDHASVLTYLFILGLVLATAVQLSKSLWLTLGIHWAANIVYYITVDIYPTESLVDGHQSTWVLAACYLALFILLALALGFNKNNKPLTASPIPDLA